MVVLLDGCVGGRRPKARLVDDVDRVKGTHRKKHKVKVIRNAKKRKLKKVIRDGNLQVVVFFNLDQTDSSLVDYDSDGSVGSAASAASAATDIFFVCA